MPRAAPNFGHVQMKAVLFMLLLAGHDCVRVTEEVQWSKSKWDQLHEDCTWSFTKGCGGEGCVRKRLSLDLTPSASCRHTDAYLLKHNGMKNFQTIVNHLQEKSDKFAQSCQGARFWSLGAIQFKNTLPLGDANFCMGVPFFCRRNTSTIRSLRK